MEEICLLPADSVVGYLRRVGLLQMQFHHTVTPGGRGKCLSIGAAFFQPLAPPTIGRTFVELILNDRMLFLIDGEVYQYNTITTGFGS